MASDAPSLCPTPFLQDILFTDGGCKLNIVEGAAAPREATAADTAFQSSRGEFARLSPDPISPAACHAP